jgi:hypothetical protein
LIKALATAPAPPNPPGLSEYAENGMSLAPLRRGSFFSKVLGTNVWIKVRLRGKQPDIKRVIGGTLVFREIDDVIAFYRNGKKIECKKYADGFSDPDTR